jgi:hypothetical protein
VPAIDDLILARDALAAEIRGEQQARAQMVANGQPPPVTYTVGNKNYLWTEWLTAKIENLKELNALIIEMGGGADNGLYEERVRGYSA